MYCLYESMQMDICKGFGMSSFPMACMQPEKLQQTVCNKNVKGNWQGLNKDRLECGFQKVRFWSIEMQKDLLKGKRKIDKMK